MAQHAHPPTIDLKGVQKMYRGKVHALRGVDLRVEPGEVFGLLGPNGAGKSTLVKIMMTVISPTSCTGTLLGAPVGDKATLSRVGYLPEHHKFPSYLKGEQVLDYYAALANVPRKTRKKRAAELLDVVGLSEWGKKKVGGYSKGMRQRLGIAQALMNDPDLIILDEPTDGVDPVGRRDIRNILTKLKAEGKTIFLNSHLLSELEMVCDRVSIMVKGLVAQQGTIAELTDHRACYTVRVAPEHADFVSQAMSSLAPNGSLATGEEVTSDGSAISIKTKDPAVAQPVLDALRAKGATVLELRAHRPSLEDLFMEAVIDPTTGKALSPGAAPGTPPGAQSRKEARA